MAMKRVKSSFRGVTSVFDLICEMMAINNNARRRHRLHQTIAAEAFLKNRLDNLIARWTLKKFSLPLHLSGNSV